jgi:hypothetical protein
VTEDRDEACCEVAALVVLDLLGARGEAAPTVEVGHDALELLLVEAVRSAVYRGVEAHEGCPGYLKEDRDELPLVVAHGEDHHAPKVEGDRDGHLHEVHRETVVVVVVDHGGDLLDPRVEEDHDEDLLDPKVEGDHDGHRREGVDHGEGLHAPQVEEDHGDHLCGLEDRGEAACHAVSHDGFCFRDAEDGGTWEHSEAFLGILV